jgi:hypothetical protein
MLPYSGKQRRVVRISTNVSEEFITSIFRVKNVRPTKRYIQADGKLYNYRRAPPPPQILHEYRSVLPTAVASTVSRMWPVQHCSWRNWRLILSLQFHQTCSGVEPMKLWQDTSLVWRHVAGGNILSNKTWSALSFKFLNTKDNHASWMET